MSRTNCRFISSLCCISPTFWGYYNELGITLRQVQKFEAGDIDMSRVQLGTALKLSAALHVRPEDLIPPADPVNK